MPPVVLIVSRDQKVTATLGDAMKSTGEKWHCVATVEEAWERLKTENVGAVVLDLTAGAWDGLALVRTARANVKTADVPFLFLIKGSYKAPILPPAGPEMVKDGWLPLPCPAPAFTTLVRRLLEQWANSRKSGHVAIAAAGTAPRGKSGVVGAQNKPGSAVVQAQKSGSGVTSAPTGSVPMIGTASGLMKRPTQTASGNAVPMTSGNIPVRPPALLEGQLGDIDVTKILGIIEPLRMTGILTVTDGKRIGEIHFVEGAVWHAAFADIEGPDALFLLFHMQSGHFHFNLGKAIERRSIQANTMALLLEGMRQMDESKRLIKEFQDKRGGPLE